MGTHSFWEGVDLVGETMSCLVIARLPFAVFTEPIIEARAKKVEEDGGNSFTGFTLPSAVIRFRQGFGRLIRHRSDRGVVVVADKRILSRRYGGWFRNSLPARVHAVQDPEQCLRGIEEFLGQA
jgi:ATP-dependent DNA helicase DinG